jgi:hypothetical protein
MGFVYVESEDGSKGGAVPGAVEVFFVFPWKEYHLPETEFHQTKDCGFCRKRPGKKLKPTVVLFLRP